ncbi:MAG TPA: hypothetical protein VHV51_18655 [Polyangiaceae bacterium]|nr:hypothetical protein [Polyangiaceae bacterium]
MIRSIALSLACAALLGFAIWATNPASAAGSRAARTSAEAASTNAPAPARAASSSTAPLAPSSSAPSTNPADSSGALERRLDRLEREIENPKR